MTTITQPGVKLLLQQGHDPKVTTFLLPFRLAAGRLFEFSVLPLSQTAGYAVLALSCLEGPEGKPVRVMEVAARTGIPRAYLSNVMHALAQKGLIRARRGNKGGVTLAQPAGEICLATIAEAVDGTSWRDACLLGFSECSDARACPAHAYWKEERERIYKLLLDITLKDISQFEKREGAVPLVDARTSNGDRPARRNKPE